MNTVGHMKSVAYEQERGYLIYSFQKFQILKTFFSSLLLLLGLCQFSQVLADPPVKEQTISNISLVWEGGHLNGTIVLTNGWIFHITDYKKRSDTEIASWGPGDILAFDAGTSGGVLYFTATRSNGNNPDGVEPYLIFDNVNSPKSGDLILENNESGKYVLTSDKSSWYFSWLNRFSTQHWQYNDRLLITGKENPYYFINLDSTPISAAKAKGEFATHGM